jgi:deleted-in-malignant-brain-tumors protein 1
MSFRYSNCNSNNYAAAPCNDGDVQLVGDRRYANFGRVEVCVNGNWSRLCGINATQEHASVICKQLGLSPHGNIHISTHVIPRLLWLIGCGYN